MTDVDKFEERQSRLPAIPEEQTSFFAAIERLAKNPLVDVAKIQQIMDMQEHILDRNAKQESNAAMVRVQSNIPIVPKDKMNEGTKPPSPYSSYEMIMKHCKPVYTTEGFAVSTYEGSQVRENEKFPVIAEGDVRIFGDVMHEGGWSKTYYVDIPLDDKGPQGTKNKTLPHAKKSSLSYGRSALMCMVLNIPTGDGDDGNAAGKSSAYITDKQLSIITTMIDEKSITHSRIKKFMGVDELSHILAKDYEKAVAGIRATEAKGKEQG